MTYLACIWLSVHVTGSGPYFYHVGSHLDHLPPRLWHILAYGVFRVGGGGGSASASDKKGSTSGQLRSFNYLFCITL